MAAERRGHYRLRWQVKTWYVRWNGRLRSWKLEVILKTLCGYINRLRQLDNMSTKDSTSSPSSRRNNSHVVWTSSQTVRTAAPHSLWRWRLKADAGQNLRNWYFLSNSLLTESSFHSRVTELAISARVETTHLDGVGSVWGESRQSHTTSCSAPWRRVSTKFFTTRIRTTVDVETVNNWSSFRRHVLETDAHTQGNVM